MIHAHIIVCKEEDILMSLFCQKFSHGIPPFKVLQADVGNLFLPVIIVNAHKRDLALLT